MELVPPWYMTCVVCVSPAINQYIKYNGLLYMYTQWCPSNHWLWFASMSCHLCKSGHHSEWFFEQVSLLPFFVKHRSCHDSKLLVTYDLLVNREVEQLHFRKSMGDFVGHWVLLSGFSTASFLTFYFVYLHKLVYVLSWNNLNWIEGLPRISLLKIYVKTGPAKLCITPGQFCTYMYMYVSQLLFKLDYIFRLATW